MKKLKLRGWVKVVLTIIILGVSAVLYSKLGVAGQYVNKSQLADTFLVVGWFWLIFGQGLFLYSIWES